MICYDTNDGLVVTMMMTMMTGEEVWYASNCTIMNKTLIDTRIHLPTGPPPSLFDSIDHDWLVENYRRSKLTSGCRTAKSSVSYSQHSKIPECLDSLYHYRMRSITITIPKVK